MYWLTQTKNNVAALELRRVLGVCYRTAWRLKHKLLQVMVEAEADRRLGSAWRPRPSRHQASDSGFSLDVKKLNPTPGLIWREPRPIDSLRMMGLATLLTPSHTPPA
jgi:hypothetical protein